MKRKLSAEELLLWQSQLKSVKPLPKTVEIPQEPIVPKKCVPLQPSRRLLEIKKGGPLSPSPLQGFGRKELRHLKIEGRLDMHGLSIEKGYDALEHFLIRAQERGFKTVLIITGKGAVSSENTLRHQLPRWIKERPVRHLVSSFHSPARQQHGGQGACYIVVRKAVGSNQ